ncbi:MAG: beta-galactosidase [Verrucomicrobiota bacterium]
MKQPWRSHPAAQLFFLAVLFVFNGHSAEQRAWPEYQAIMWVGDSAYKKPEKIPLFFKRMEEIGVNAITLGAEVAPALATTNGFGFYVENIVNRGLCLKFNSTVIDWDKFVTGWAKNGRPDSALIRDYCLEDPDWRARSKKQMERAAQTAMPGKPLLYDIRDELSVTLSANPFDYDFAPRSLNAFREWLEQEYGSFDRLNEQWQTRFKNWDEVKPFTTDQIKNRMATNEPLPGGKPDWSEVQKIRFNSAKASENPTRWNFSPWADFRTFMDSSLVDALREFRESAHAIDPATPVGIEGTQMPSAWGGYDLWKLSQSLDWVEPYDIGNAREIFGSFMPGKPILTTVFETDRNHASRRLWHLLLEGDKGAIIWWSEDCIDWQSADYKLTSKARELAPVLKAMRSPLARLFMTAKREYDPIAIHYSQPSVQVDWLIESTVDGSTWLRRFSSYEADHNRMVRVRNSWLKAFQDLGFTPKFISSEQIESGGLNGAKVFVMPQSLAISDSEAARITQFSKHGNLFADGTPGMFDAHGKLRARPAFNDWFPLANSDTRSFARSSGKTEVFEGNVADYAKDRASGKGDFAAWVVRQIKNITPTVTVPIEAKIRVHRYKQGSAQLIALERNISYQMSEDLKQAGGNEALESSIDIAIKIITPGHCYDLRTGKYLGESGTLKVHIDPWEPTLLAVCPSRIQASNSDELVQQLLAN